MYREGSNWVQEMTGDLGAAKNLRVKLAAGSVRVQGGSQAGITYVIHRKAYTSSEEKARREFESYRITTSSREIRRGSWPKRAGGIPSAPMILSSTVPRNLGSAKIETGGGSVNATGVAGRVELNSGGGNIRLDDIGGEVTAETGGGTIDVGSVQGNVNLQTGGGNIKVASAKGEIKAESGGGNVVVLSGLQGAVLETGGGSIRVDKCSGHVKATTGGGSVDLGEIGGPAEIETGAGSIRLASAKGSRAGPDGRRQHSNWTARRRCRRKPRPAASSLSCSRPRALTATRLWKLRLAILPSIWLTICQSRSGRRSKSPMGTASTAIFRIFTCPAKADRGDRKR